MNYLLYQAYGKKEIIDEAIFSIISFFNASSKSTQVSTSIIVYTDSIPSFQKIFGNQSPIIFEILNADTIKEWRGEIDFVHRVKIKMLQDFFEKYDGSVLYVDTDTYFLQDIVPLFDEIKARKVFMHISEGRIDSCKNPIFKKMYRIFKKNTFLLPDRSPIQIPVSTDMWNAGVIGMHSFYLPILDKVLNLTDALYHRHAKHVMEQFSFSYYFQQNNTIYSSQQYIFHYWNFKELRLILADLFSRYNNKSVEEWCELSKKIVPMDLIKPKLEYENLRGFKKILRKLKGQKWKMPVVDL
jgi:hypothetical protein